MTVDFWQQLNNPFFCLAPMEEVTDVAFREMFAKHSGQWPVISDRKRNAFVMFTEFVNVDGLTHPEGYKKLSLDLEFTENQRPMVAQIWGTNPQKFLEAAKIVVGLGFDGIDINMGCPQDKEIGIGACAALIRDHKLAGEIIEATIKGADGLPVSVKTRLGYSKADEMNEWVSHLLQFDIAALTLHARTKQEKSKVPAQWNKIADAVKIRNEVQSVVIASAAEAISGLKLGLPRRISDALNTPRNDKTPTLIIGNGDVKSRAEGLQKVKETGCDGVMIARGAFGNPWIFREDGFAPTIKERLSVMLEHARLFNEKLGAHKNFVIMRKHFKAYASGFDGAAELRAKLMETKSLEEVESIVRDTIKE